MEFKTIELKESIFANNDREADRLRAELKGDKTFLLNLMSSPGADPRPPIPTSAPPTPRPVLSARVRPPARSLPTVPASSARNVTNFLPGTTVPAVKTVPVTGAVLPGPSRAPDAPRTAAMPAPAPGPATRRSKTRGWTASPASCP